MGNIYYFDTSIWLDFLEDRNEPNLPKSTWAIELINKIILEESKIILSDNNIIEFEVLGYSRYDIENLLDSLKSIIVSVESTPQQISRSKDLSEKRNVPKRDALHALIARDNKALLITLDAHFNKLMDIAMPHNPKEFIYA